MDGQGYTPRKRFGSYKEAAEAQQAFHIVDLLLQDIIGWLSRPFDTRTQLNRLSFMSLMAYPRRQANGRITNSTTKTTNTRNTRNYVVLVHGQNLRPECGDIIS
jgi:hypothetical protein